MFGSDPLWGQQQPVNVGGASPYPMLPQQPLPQMPQVAQQRGGGMFGAGGVGRNIVGMIGDALMAQAHMQPMYAPFMMRQREEALRHQQEIDDYNRKRQDDNSDWQTRYNYELQNPKEGVGSEYERLLAAAGIMPGTPAYQQHVNAKVNQLENPMVMTPYGPMPYSAVNPSPPTAPVGKLTPIDGGQTGAPSGGFPY